MVASNYHILISSFALVSGTLLITALLFRRVNTTANRILSLSLAFTTYASLVNSFYVTGYIDHVPWLMRSSFPLGLSCCPLIYFYVCAQTCPEWRLRQQSFWHAAVPAIGLTWYLGFLFFGRPHGYWVMGNEFFIEKYLRSVVFCVLMAGYLGASLRRLREYQRKLLNAYSSVEGIRLTWLRVVLYCTSLTWLLAILDVLSGPNVHLWEIVPTLLAIELGVMAVFALRQSPVFDVEYAAPSPVARPEEPRRPLSAAAEKLKSLVIDKKMYLNPKLRLLDLAEELRIRPQEVSQILNEELRTSFYDLVNNSRVAEARARLVAAEYAHMSILAIAIDCGFNSKSTFNDCFRKATGQTPSAFRQNALATGGRALPGGA